MPVVTLFYRKVVRQLNINYDKMTMLRVAKYYYLDEMSQQEIAQKENIHRSQISRILKAARELGYVQIRICTPESDVADTLATQLKALLGLKEISVTPAVAANADPKETLYFFAARYLEKLLPQCKRIGIGVGQTLYKVAEQLTPQKVKERPDFFSVAGFSGTDNPYLQASIILDNFARPFQGYCHYNNFSICTSCARMSPLEITRFQELQAAYQKIDTVVLSIGGPFSKSYPYLEEFSLAVSKSEVLQALQRPHGNLLGHVFNDEYECLQLPQGYCITSMGLQDLEAAPNVICIAGGQQKVEAIISAAKQHYINVLITDETTALQMLHTLKKEKPE